MSSSQGSGLGRTNLQKPSFGRLERESGQHWPTCRPVGRSRRSSYSAGSSTLRTGQTSPHWLKHWRDSQKSGWQDHLRTQSTFLEVLKLCSELWLIFSLIIQDFKTFLSSSTSSFPCFQISNIGNTKQTRIGLPHQEKQTLKIVLIQPCFNPPPCKFVCLPFEYDVRIIHTALV